MSCWEICHSQDGRLALKDAPSLSASHLYGYQVYTSFCLPLPERWLSAHLTRLFNDAKALDIDYACDRALLSECLLNLHRPEQPVNRLSLMADVRQYSAFYETSSLPGQLILSRRSAPPPSDQPLRLNSVGRQKYLPHLKLGEMTETIHRKRLVHKNGDDDLLWINHRGNVCEASSANVFFIHKGGLLTPDPERDGCLPGITRYRVLEIAENHNFADCTVRSIPLDVLETMDGAFLTNAVQGIISVNSIDAVIFPWPLEALALVEKIGWYLANQA